jgi:hypothetical protein
MTVDENLIEELRRAADPPLDLSWLNPPTAVLQRPELNQSKLTLQAIAAGPYGELPEHSENWNARMRGSAALPGAGRLGVRYGEKGQSWSEAVMLLYEEAQARQWNSATDLPWDQLTDLPDDVELAMCQLCTALSQFEFTAGDIPGGWIKHISNDFFETKLFLATQISDEARHLEVFRKRALANGAGLLQASRSISLATADFAEMVAMVHLTVEGMVQSMFRMGELIGNNELEKRMFRLAAQDESRHVAFGVMYLKHLLESQPWRHDEMRGHFSSGQIGFGIDENGNEALAILLGKGKKNIDEGYLLLLAVRQKQLRELTQRLRVVGLSDLADDLEKRRSSFLAGEPLESILN